MVISLNQNLKNFKVNTISYEELTRKLPVNCIFTLFFFLLPVLNLILGGAMERMLVSMFVSDDAVSHCS